MITNEAKPTAVAGLVPCSVCGTGQARRYLDRTWKRYEQTYDLVKCENCGSAFTAPMPTDAALGKFYASDFDYRWYRDHYDAKVRDCRTRIAEYRPIAGK